MSDLVRRQKDATRQHYLTIQQEQEQNQNAANFLLSENNSNEHNKMTIAMKESLLSLQSSLSCPLCHNVLVQPVTIPCAHTFCCDCIDRFTDNSWVCPIPMCGMPVTMKGRNQAKFRNINSATQTVVSSWAKICNTLSKAEDGWWRDNEQEEQSINDDDDSSTDYFERPKDDDNDDDDDSSTEDEDVFETAPDELE